MGETTIIIISLIIFNLVLIIFISAIVIFVRQYRIKKKVHLAEIHSIDEIHRQELLETQVEIQSQTMKHIGREIHDNIGQKLTLASLYTQQLAFENKAPQINQNIENISDIINQSLIELRQLSKSLTDNSLKNSSISELIEQECNRINDLKICDISLDINSNITIESYQVKSFLFRISQEFLQNSIKHSKCKNIYASLHQDNDNILLIIKDDGKGFFIEKLKSTGIGLKNMKKRTKLIGGSFLLESEKNIGTKLTIEIPLK